MDMSQILREVGRGKRGSRDLNYAEALNVAEHILKQQVSPAQTAAFLMAERMKMENVEEMEAFVHACRNSAERFSVFQDSLIVRVLTTDEPSHLWRHTLWHLYWRRWVYRLRYTVVNLYRLNGELRCLLY